MKLSGCLIVSAAFTLSLIGICALAVAEFNLIGVPMLERNMMNPTLGFVALVVAPLCFLGTWGLVQWVVRKKL